MKSEKTSGEEERERERGEHVTGLGTVLIPYHSGKITGGGCNPG